MQFIFQTIMKMFFQTKIEVLAKSFKLVPLVMHHNTRNNFFFESSMTIFESLYQKIDLNISTLIDFILK